MNTWDIHALEGLLVESGRIALRYYENPPTEYKRDRSPVTKADREIEDLLGKSFDRPGEGSYLIGEETVEKRDGSYIDAAFKATSWVVDPIDGTALYANHLPCWGVSVGLMERGLLTEGAIYFPLDDELFITEGGAILQGRPGSLVRIEATRRPYSLGGVIAITQEIARYEGIEVANPIYAGGSAVYPLTQLLLGHFIAYVGQLNLWDVAGCLPLLRNAGFDLRLQEGPAVTGAVDAGAYILSPGDAKRWKYRSNLICTGAPETLDRVMDGLRAAHARRKEAHG